MPRSLSLRLALVGWAVLSVLPRAAAVEEVWTAKLPADAKWHQITGLGTLLVGTDKQVLNIDPQSGKILWSSERFKKTTTQNVVEVAGAPILVANDQHGFGGTKSTLVGLDYLTGKELWNAPEIQGQFLGSVALPAHGAFVGMYVGYDAEQGNGTYIVCYDAATGERRWLTKYGKAGAVVVHLSDSSGMFTPQTDLSGHQTPLIEGDIAYLPYLGIHALDLKSGKILWGVPFETADAANKKAYPGLRVEGDRIYGGGGGIIHCLNKQTGEVLWESKRVAQSGLKVWKDGVLSQIEIVGERVFVRMGGNYSNGKEVVLKKPLGVLCLDKATGRELWRSKEIDKGITNLVPLPERGLLICADGDSLIGIDATAEGYVEKFHCPIEFKHRMGGADVAQIGLGMLGGLSGMAKAAASSSNAREDLPLVVSLAQGKAVVRGKQHVLLLDPATGTMDWSLAYTAPSQGWAMAAMFALTAAQGLYGNAQVANSGGYGSQYNQGVGTIHDGLDNYNRFAAQRASATQGNERYVYVLTNIEEGKKKAIGIVGINLETGATDRQIVLKDKEPDYLADEAAGRVYYFKGGDQIVAYAFKP